MTHGGNIKKLMEKMNCSKDELLDFSANINPLGFPDSVLADYIGASEDIIHYPDVNKTELLLEAAKYYSVDVNNVVAGNGSNELLFSLFKSLKPKNVILPTPCYKDYITAANYSETNVVWSSLNNHDFTVEFSDISKKATCGDFIILGRPNNPTGKSPSLEDIYDLCEKHNDCYIIVDEAFIDLTYNDKLQIKNHSNLIILRSMTKNFAIPGVRLGFALASSEVISLVESNIVPWSVNTISQRIGVGLFSEAEFLDESRELIEKNRKYIVEKLAKIPALKVFEGEANFILLQSTKLGLTAPELSKILLKSNIAIRTCSDYEGLDDSYFRVAVKDHRKNIKLVEAISRAFGVSPDSVKKKRPSLMFQGTCSDAGKSIMTTALCRILNDDGIKVAPFKAQNMSLNSFVTKEGLEMGRAQVTQAYGARVEPDVRMNPVLLKPNSQMGSQVILKGKPIGNKKAFEYYEYKRKIFESVQECYDSLQSEYDAVVLEGAGSPGEINLKKHDIVNMRMAEYAQSPVLLVGDIDRGGVFSSFIGTFATLSPWEKELLKGFVINKFRGDRKLLGDAFDITKRFTNRDVVGTIDNISGLIIPDEDSVSFKSSSFKTAKAELNVAFIDLPHISNATDGDSMKIEPDVGFDIIRKSQDLSKYDLIVVPGSKNVINDLNWVKESGLAKDIIHAHLNDISIVGICGGFQILGETISDPHEIEGKNQTVEGLALLSSQTHLAEDKTLKLTNGFDTLSRCKVTGYEIHHGETAVQNGLPWIKSADGRPLGYKNSKESVFGTYLHGVFDEDKFRRSFLNALRAKKKLQIIEEISTYDIDKSIDILAKHVREEMDMDFVYKVMGL